jgi:hypothetical protein
MAKRAKKAAQPPAAPVIHQCEGCGMQMRSPPELIPALCPGCVTKPGATNAASSEEQASPDS